MDYAQARIQARFGERPDETAWQAIRNARETAAVLEAARSSGLRRWVAGLEASSGTHAIEITLRARWRECVGELASWMPADWRPATLWVGGLADLPALCHLARGDPPLPWMGDDPVLRPYVLADPIDRQSRVMREALAFADLAPPSPEIAGSTDHAFESRARKAWYEAWRRLWPVRREAATIVALVALVESGSRQPLAAGGHALLRRMRSLFRELTLRPAAAFVFLALVAADIGRLRAELLQRVLLRESGLAP